MPEGVHMTEQDVIDRWLADGKRPARTAPTARDREVLERRRRGEAYRVIAADWGISGTAVRVAWTKAVWRDYWHGPTAG